MKSFKLLASIAAISAVFGCASTAPSMTDGTYTGVGQGRNGELTVEVKVDAGKLSAVRVVKHVETVGISDAAVKQMPARIVDAQSLKVDAVSGATLTSEGIRTAVADAIRKAGGDPDGCRDEEGCRQTHQGKGRRGRGRCGRRGHLRRRSCRNARRQGDPY